MSGMSSVNMAAGDTQETLSELILQISPPAVPDVAHCKSFF